MRRAPAAMNCDLAVEWVCREYPALAAGVEFILCPPEEWPAPGALGLVGSDRRAVLLLERRAPVGAHVNTLRHELAHLRGAGEGEARRAGREAERRYTRRR